MHYMLFCYHAYKCVVHRVAFSLILGVTIIEFRLKAISAQCLCGNADERAFRLRLADPSCIQSPSLKMAAQIQGMRTYNKKKCCGMGFHGNYTFEAWNCLSLISVPFPYLI